MRKLRMLAACEMSGRVRNAFAVRGWEAWSADILPSESPSAITVEAYDDMGQRKYARSHRVINVLPGTHHYIGDVRDLFSWEHPVNDDRWHRKWERYNKGDHEHPDIELPVWDLVIAFPPCTHLSLAGARYWKAKREPRYDENFEETWSVQDEAAAFFLQMTRASAPHVAVENPRGDMSRRYRPPDQYVQPWWFGDPLRKQTGLWLKNLPLLYADNTVIPTGRVATGGGSHRTDVRAGRGPANGHEDGEGRARRQIVRNRTLENFARAMASQWGSYVEKEAA